MIAAIVSILAWWLLLLLQFGLVIAVTASILCWQSMLLLQFGVEKASIFMASWSQEGSNLQERIHDQSSRFSASWLQKGLQKLTRKLQSFHISGCSIELCNGLTFWILLEHPVVLWIDLLQLDSVMVSVFGEDCNGLTGLMFLWIRCMTWSYQLFQFLQRKLQKADSIALFRACRTIKCIWP